MRYSIWFVLFFLVSSQLYAQRTAGLNANDIDSIIAYKINSDRTSMIDIKCSELKGYGDEVEKFNLTRYKNRIVDDLRTGKPALENLPVDARAVIELWHKSGKVDTVCTCNLMYVSVNRKEYNLPNRDITYLLDSLYIDNYKRQKGK